MRNIALYPSAILQLLLLLVVVVEVVVVSGAAPVCPCSTPSLCEPIKAGSRKELFAFQLETDLWQYYDWSKITTLAVFGPFDPMMVCTAHAHNARVVFGASLSVDQLYNLSATSDFIVSQYEHVVATFADGINIDIEDELLSPEDATQLTEFVGNVSGYFYARNPSYQVTYDVAWSPNCIDKRCYDYVGLAGATEFLVMMDYDMRSQIFGPCVASANSPPNLVLAGLANFTKLGIPADKLVLGLPWYGYDYPCTAISEDGVVCQIKEVPFRGVNCSDAAGTELAYTDLDKLLQQSTTGPQWNTTLQSPWFNYIDTTTKQTHQIWYDDPQSLSIKTSLAKMANLRGVGMWTADFVDYINNPKSAEAFWEAMNQFFL